MNRSLAIATTATAIVAAAAPPAQATFPGENGEIAFQRVLDPSADVSGQLFAVAPGGHKPHQLTDLPGAARDPDYSPDGKRIAFALQSAEGKPDALYTVNADGSDPLAVPAHCTGDCLGEGEPGWSPTVSRIVFARAFGPVVDGNASAIDLVAENSDGTAEELIRHYSPVTGGREAHLPRWSPDGRLLAVCVVNTTAKPKNRSVIYLMDAHGKYPRRITPPRLNAGIPDWSPNGKRIVFNSSHEVQGPVELYTVRIDGSGLKRVRREPKSSFSFDPVWSPDGRRIAFVHGTAKTVPHVWTIKPNGTKMRQETRGPLPDFTPDWGTAR